MRLWTLSLDLLDSKGLVALWRETLLAKNVLRGNTKGYKNHPQLDRFKESEQPLVLIEKYLSYIYNEATARGYNFNKDKISWGLVEAYSESYKIPVTRGQLNYECQHLKSKLIHRDFNKYVEIKEMLQPTPIEMFWVLEDEFDIEYWEKV